MPKYTQYSIETGEIMAVVNCAERDADLHQPCISGGYSALEYKVVDGVAVRKGQDQIDEVLLSQAWVDFKTLRDGYLQSTDWTQVPDAPVDQQAWATYRQELRDLPDNTEDPRNPVWPTKPS